jgi:ribosomal protein S18 acetylase RimI-like enzyme
MTLLLREQEFEQSWHYRTISEEDIALLGRLMYESYRDTIDYEGETLEDALEEIRGAIRGQYGPFMENCSFVIEKQGEAASTCLISWSEEFHRPLLTYSMTHPTSKNQGMGTFLLKKSINTLLEQGYQELNLVVTEGNIPAQRLYQKLGFRTYGGGN